MELSKRVPCKKLSSSSKSKKKFHYKRYNVQVLLISILFVGLMGYAFYSPNITGFVSVNIYRQNVSLVIDQSQNFFLTSDNIVPFIITSFKVSGEVIGEGKVKVLIDSGKGQRLTVYDNIMKEKLAKRKLLEITTRAVDDVKENVNKKNDKWLIIKPINVLLEKEVFDTVEDDELIFSGEFNNKCAETCFVKMEMARDIAYRLIFLVEEGTILKINRINFQTSEE